jgi:transposase InsO family protein
MLNIIDEFSKEALVIRVKRKLNSVDVVDALTDLFIMRGPPDYIRSDNGAEFIAKKVRAWIGAVGAKTAFVAPGSPWENGYCESFNARFRDEFLNGEVFYTLREAQILIERWRRHYNTVRPHSALGYRPPAPESLVQVDQEPDHALTFMLDHSMGADHDGVKDHRLVSPTSQSQMPGGLMTPGF